MNYDVVIGLETHIELNTQTKVFCACENSFGGEPNSHCCPICIGLPGVLPELNKEAVKKTVLMGLATNCDITKEFYFDRKHYFYPDLAKSYQISQNNTPICKNGYVEIELEDKSTKKIRIHQIHLEEDAGKLTHLSTGETTVDYNRGGVPLIEIVSEPDMSSVGEAINYVTYLKELVKRIGVSNCKMEQGQLRCDVNVSIKPEGSSVLGTKVEMKNINSFKAIERAINYEINRQLKMVENGEKIVAETRRWDDSVQEGFPMRSKEGAKDYRFMPEPDIPTTILTDSYINSLKEELPLLPRQVRAKLIDEYGLGEYDANLISKDSSTTAFFFEVIKYYKNAKKISNWITSEINKRLNLSLTEDKEIPLNAKEFANLLNHVDAGDISQMGSRTLLSKLWEDDTSKVDDLIDQLGLRLNNNDDELKSIVEQIIINNPKAVADHKAGKNVTAFFVGQVMKATKGQADAGKVNKLIGELLK